MKTSAQFFGRYCAQRIGVETGRERNTDAANPIIIDETRIEVSFFDRRRIDRLQKAVLGGFDGEIIFGMDHVPVEAKLPLLFRFRQAEKKLRASISCCPWFR